jgi:hypothetical protein
VHGRASGGRQERESLSGRIVLRCNRYFRRDDGRPEAGEAGALLPFPFRMKASAGPHAERTAELERRINEIEVVVRSLMESVGARRG